MSQRRIAVSELEKGMLIAELDRPWLETGFAFQRFRVDSDELLDRVRAECETVMIVVDDGGGPDGGAMTGRHAASAHRAPVAGGATRVDQLHFHHELPVATRVHADLGTCVRDVLADLREGRGLEVDRLKAAAEPMIESVERSPDALHWLSSIRRADDGLYRQAVLSAVLATTYGLHLGLARESLRDLALGALLLDVGTIELPEGLTAKREPWTGEELLLYREHVAAGVRILKGCSGISADVLAMVQCHHERHDGSGYDRGLRGDAIPPFGKIAGIVDAYQGMVHGVGTGVPLPAHTALLKLARRRGAEFDAAVVEEFIQAIGIYPTGSIVRLNDGRTGLVVEQNRRWRLKPKVMVVLDEAGGKVAASDLVDLAYDPKGADGRPIAITDVLEEGAQGISAADYYL